MTDQGTNRPVYIEGYFTKLLREGVKPTYGYPLNHLPEPKVETMQVVTGFFASREDAS